MSALPDLGAPISYLVLETGVPVYTSDGTELGELKRVLAVPEDDVFDGLIVDTREGERFVDGDHAGRLYERGIVLEVSDADASHLHDPEGNPAALEVTPDDLAADTTGDHLRDRLRRAWDLISGKY